MNSKSGNITEPSPKQSPIDGDDAAQRLNAGVGVAFGFESVWVTSGTGDALYRIDASSNTLTATLDIGDGPMFVVAGEDSVWQCQRKLT